MTFNVNAQVVLLPPTNAAQIASNLRKQLQNVNATINVKMSKQSARTINQANTQLKKTTASAKEAAGAITDFGKQAALAGKRFFAFTVATTAILKLAGAVKEGIGEAIAFQRELIKISQVTGNSINNLKALTKEITRLSTNFGVASDQLLQSSRILAQTGLSAEKTRIALEALAKSDLAPTFDNIISTTEGAIAIFRQFGVEADKLEAKLGSINAVASKFAVESSDIITAVRRTGGAFAAAGGSLEELIALFTSVRATTRESAESIATGFRTIFTRLQRVRTQNFLETLGIDLKDVEGQFVGPLEAIRRLHLALAKLPSTDPRFAQIIEELGGFRQVSKVIPLIQQFDTAERALNVAMAGTSSLSKDAAVAQGALAIQIKKTREEFVAMIRNMANSTSFKAMISLSLKLASAFIKIADALKPLLPLLTVVGGLALGRMAIPFVKSFKAAGGFGLHEGGPIRKFASGGLVPGVGNRDTVPARLTPGEYVIKKSTVKKIGIDNLQHLAEGGIAKKNFGAVISDVQPEARGRGANKKESGTSYEAQISVANINNKLPSSIKRQGYKVAINGDTDPKTFLKYNMPIGYVSPDAKNILINRGKTVIDKAVEGMAKRLVSDVTINTQAKVPNEPAIIGSMFEGVLRKLGAPYTDYKDTDDFDFPYGLRGDSQKLFKNAQLHSMPVDAKSNLLGVKKSQGGLKFKAINYIVKKLETQGSFDAFKLIQPGQQKAGGGRIDEPNALLTPGEYVVDKQTANMIGISALDRINKSGRLPGYASGGSYGSVFKPTLTGRGLGAGNLGRKKQWKVQRKAFLEQGKKLGILTPAELQELKTLNARIRNMAQMRTPRHAKYLGFSKGGAFGRIRRYAGGGYVGGGGGLNNFASVGFAMAGLSALITTFEGLNKTVDKVVSVFSNIASQATLLAIALKTVVGMIGKFDQKIEKYQNTKGALQEQLVQRRETNKQMIKSLEDQLLQETAAGKPTADTEKKLRVTRAYADNQIRSLNKQISAQNKAIQSINKMQSAAQLGAVAVGVLSAAMQAFATYLEQEGKKQIEAGGSKGRFIASKALGGASKGFGFGAAIGGAIGTALVPFTGGLSIPAGMAIGGAVGAGGGAGIGVYFGSTEADNIAYMSNFNKRLKQTTAIFEDLQKKLTTYNLQRFDIIQSLKDSFGTFSQANLSSTGRQDIVAGIKSQIQGYTGFFQDAAKSAKSFGEFLDIVGRDTLNSFAILTEQGISTVVSRYKHQIAEQEKAAKIQLKLNSLTEEYNRRLQTIVDTTRAFNDIAITIKNLNGRLSTLADLAGGGAGLGFKVNDQSARLARPGEFGNTDKFIEVLTNAITNNPLLQTKFPGQESSISTSLTKDMMDIQDAVDRMPAVLINLRESIGSFDPKKAVDKLIAQFDDASPYVKDAIRIAANNIIGSEGKEEKLISAIQKDLIGVSKKLVAGFKPTTEAAAKMAKAMNDEKNRRLDFLAQLANLTKKEIEIRNRGIDIQIQAEQLRAKAYNRPTNLNKLQKLDTEKLKSFGVETNPLAIGLKLEDAKNKLLKLQNKYAKESLDGRKRLDKEIKKQQDVIIKSNRALTFLADVGNRTAVIMQKISKEQARAQFKSNLLDRGLSLESPTQAMDFQSLLYNTRVAGATGSIDYVQPEKRGEVVSFLKSIGDLKLGSLGGKSGKEILQQMREDFAKKLGATDEQAKKWASEQTSELTKLQAALEEIIKTSADANKVAQDVFRKDSLNLIKELDKSINTFVTEIQNIFKQQQVKREREKYGAAKGRVDRTNAALDSLYAAINKYGLQGQTREQKVERVQTIKQQLPIIKKIGEAMIRERKIGSNITMMKNLTAASFATNIRSRYADSMSGGARNTPNIFAQKFADILPQLKSVRASVGAFGGIQYDQIFNPENKTVSRNEFFTKLSDLTQVVQKMTDEKTATSFQEKVLRGAKFTNDQIDTNTLAKLLQESLVAVGKEVATEFENTKIEKGNLKRRLGGSLEGIDFENIATNFDKVSKQFAAFASDDTIQSLLSNLQEYNNALGLIIIDVVDLVGKMPKDLGWNPKTKQRGGFIHLNKGGIVPGVGLRDSVPALLTPGEAVIPRMAMGGDVLEKIKKAMHKKAEDRAIAIKTKYNDAYFAEQDKKRQDKLSAVSQKYDEKFAKIDAAAPAKAAALQAKVEASAKKEEERKQASLTSLMNRMTGEGPVAKAGPRPEESEKWMKRHNERKGITSTTAPGSIDRFIEQHNQRRLRKASPNRRKKILEQLQDPNYIWRQKFGEEARRKKMTKGELSAKKITGAYTTVKNKAEKLYNKAKTFIGGFLPKTKPSSKEKIKPLTVGDQHKIVTNLRQQKIDVKSEWMRLKAKKNLTPQETNQLINAKRRYDELERAYSKQLNKLHDLQRHNKYATGTLVPGTGSGDKIPALLEPGEFVLNRNAVQAIGVQKLHKANNKYSRFQRGGRVHMQEGGATTMAAPIDLGRFDEIIQNFGNKVDLLAESLNSINGLEIQLTANHKVEVIINGAQILQQLEPSIQNLIVSETNKAINNMLKSKFPPEIGIMY